MSDWSPPPPPPPTPPPKPKTHTKWYVIGSLVVVAIIVTIVVTAKNHTTEVVSVATSPPKDANSFAQWEVIYSQDVSDFSIRIERIAQSMMADTDGGHPLILHSDCQTGQFLVEHYKTSAVTTSPLAPDDWVAMIGRYDDAMSDCIHGDYVLSQTDMKLAAQVSARLADQMNASNP